MTPSLLAPWLRTDSGWHRWLARPAIDEGRWVVLDVESSGLDPAHDRLLAIAAIAIRVQESGACIVLGDSFEVVLRQDNDALILDRTNILLHGIGLGAQRNGVEPGEGLRRFAEFVGHSPLVAFHAAFDRQLIERAFATLRRGRPRWRWLDLEPLAAVLCPGVKAHVLDEWMAHFDIRCAVRHQAAADTLATAELLLRLWPLLRAQRGGVGFDAACRVAAQRRWLVDPSSPG